ncbi:MAG: magnesium/cobalt transporter CorA [Syntrophobacterales bacterium]|jgi:magnesium transporter
MSLFLKKSSKKAGLPPGTVVFVGEKKVEEIRITIIDYDENQYDEREIKNIEECFPYKDTPSISWINIDGVHQVDVIEKLGAHFVLHPLLQEDVVNTHQRPKFDESDDHLFIVLRMFFFDEEKNELKGEQISLIVGANFVISFQERQEDVFEQVRERLRNGKGRIRKRGSDYLAYSLIDAIVDSYYNILEKLGEHLESLQEELVSEPKSEDLKIIQHLKRNMIFFRKSVWPLREVIGGLAKSESNLIKEDVLVYVRDVYDHVIQVIDTIETFRDMLSAMLDIYLSSVGNKMNQVMKVLTIIATIFIPMTFLAGVYGMNFKYMPELELKYAYPVFWFVVFTVFIVMVIWFKRKKWF